MKDAFVQCDEAGCGWHWPVDGAKGIAEWHNKPCPLCGKGIIIKDADMWLVKVCLVAERVSKWIIRIGKCFGMKPQICDVEVNTAPRKRKP